MNTAPRYKALKLTKRAVTYGPRFDVPACKHARWVENVSRGLRLVGYSHEINRGIRHTGWYTDDEGTAELMRGVVYRLPHGRFVYGYADPYNDDCALLCFDLDADDELEAARYADRVAELAAERERDYQRKWYAAERVRCLREYVRAARGQHTALVRAIWTGEGDDATGARLRADVRGAAHKAIEELRGVIEEHGAEILGNEFN